jgi:hypothetical protein
MSDSRFKTISGRCECSAVAYDVSAPAQELYHCHCSRCRRLHGSLFATYAYVLRKDIQITHGASRLSTYRSKLADWHFCQNCGCHLFAEHDHNPGVMWYMPATLSGDAAPGYPEASEKHIFVASKSSIETIAGDIPQHDEYAPPELSITARKEAAAI